MGKLKKIITTLHTSTKRDYLGRMNDNKIQCMKIANKFDKNYWDGLRKFGYGGYKFIPGRWSKAAKKILDDYKIKPYSKILDIGCGKGFLLYEMLQIDATLKIYGIDTSSYALKKSIKHKNITYFKRKAEKKLPYKKNHFDLVISINTLHNLFLNDLSLSLKEISRVGKKSYLCVESYNNENQLFNLQCWALTCKSFFSKKEWLWLFKKLKYKGDYEFIYFD